MKKIKTIYEESKLKILNTFKRCLSTEICCDGNADHACY